MTTWLAFVKNILRTWLDNHVLPGTTTGTEILWLYLIQWKRDVLAVLSLIIVFVASRSEYIRMERSSADSTSAAQAE